MGRGFRRGVAGFFATLMGMAVCTAIPSTAHAADPPRPIPDPVRVVIGPNGLSVPDVTLAVGQTVEYTNQSGATQSITADDNNAFDSGDIPPGGGYSMAVGTSGVF